jgi:hypothetical protein
MMSRDTGAGRPEVSALAVVEHVRQGWRLTLLRWAPLTVPEREAVAGEVPFSALEGLVAEVAETEAFDRRFRFVCPVLADVGAGMWSPS